MSLQSIIDSYPREVEYEVVVGQPYVAVTRQEPPLNPDIVDRAWGERKLPKQLRDIWTTISGHIYLIYSNGSDGLEIHDPWTSLSKTEALETGCCIDEDEYHEGDIIVGDFQGYDTRLVLSPADGWLVYSSIESRDRWLRLGDTLHRFLIEFRDAGGTDGNWNQAFFND